MESEIALNPGAGHLLAKVNSSSANLFAVRLLVAFGKWLHHFKAFKENQTLLNIPLWKCFLSIQVCRTDIIIQRKQNSYYPQKWLPEFQFPALSSVCSGGRSQELFKKMRCLKSNSISSV